MGHGLSVQLPVGEGPGGPRRVSQLRSAPRRAGYKVLGMVLICSREETGKPDITTDQDPVLRQTGCGLGPRPCLDVFITELGLEAREQPADGNSRCGCGSEVGLGPGRSHKLLVATESLGKGRGMRARAGRACEWKTKRRAPPLKAAELGGCEPAAWVYSVTSDRHEGES